MAAQRRGPAGHDPVQASAGYEHFGTIVPAFFPGNTIHYGTGS